MTSSLHTQGQVQLLDVSNLLSINNVQDVSQIDAALAETCRKIGEALLDIGFFAAAPNHGVKLETMQAIEKLAKDFFDMPKEEKVKVHMDLNPTFRGYSALFAEQTLQKSDFKESFDLGTDHSAYGADVSDAFLGCNQYGPQKDFEVVTRQYHDEMRAFGHAVLRAISFYLGLPLDSMTTPENHVNENHLFRMLSYPPAPLSTQKVQGIGEHTDYGHLAMLFATHGGLEAKNVHGEWVEVPFVPYSIVVNVGDVLEIFTGGKIKSTWHRVVHQNTKHRYSFPFFYEPSFDRIISPLLPCDRPVNLNYRDHVRRGTSKSFPKHPYALKLKESDI